MVEVRNLTKSYEGLRVLDGISYSFGPGITCVLGPSGRGKTTLLRLIMGLERPDSGEILGADCRFAVVFQEDRLLEHTTALENLRFALGREFQEEEARKMLDALGMQDWEGKCVRDFSGGMKRRLALARALLVPSDCLILDEPFGGLDDMSRQCAIDRIKAARKQTILVTHDTRDPELLGAEVLNLNQGKEVHL